MPRYKKKLINAEVDDTPKVKKIKPLGHVFDNTNGTGRFVRITETSLGPSAFFGQDRRRCGQLPALS